MLRSLLNSYHRAAVLAAGLLVVLGCSVLAGAAGAAVSPQAIEGPVGPTLALKSVESIPVMAADRVDIDFALEEDEMRRVQGRPPRFALSEAVDITPVSAGAWEDLDKDYRLWRLLIDAPGAVSLNLGFSEFELPKGARLSLYPADFKGVDDVRGVRVFTERDNRPDGILWSPLVQSNRIVVELLMPRSEMSDYRLAIESINKGYRNFGLATLEKQGTCNIDVVCPEGDDWWNEINSVGVYTVNGTWYCTGAMINNTAEDGTPYFLTADHCGLSTSNDQGVVVYWNFQSANCGDLGGGSLADFTSGSTFLADNAASDVTLIQLDAVPDPNFNVTYSGWDRTDVSTASAVGIHHPNTDEKAISVEYDPTSITSWYGTTVPGDGTHLRITDWDLGTTEPGSSGSPLYSPDHRIVGQLHGGDAACGNNSSDWYGRFAVSWSVLSAYLDPLGTGAMTTDTYLPTFSGLAVSPIGTTAIGGDAGGPFDPAGVFYTVENLAGTAFDYQVTVDVPWLTVTGGSGTLSGFGTAQVEVAVNSGADALPKGDYPALVAFTNLTDGEGDTTRNIQLTVGIPHLIHSEPMDTDPGWTTAGLWAFGTPAGGGGDHGGPDPTAGVGGTNVLGYNLAGDYQANLLPTHLISLPFDCTGLEGTVVKFQRWLGVEQPLYDHASFSVGTNGVDFTTVWENDAEVYDGAWTPVEYDISAIADGQATVYLRWTMGSTDDSWQYCGWNIDEVEIWAIQSLSAVGDSPPARRGLSNHPNPFNPATRLVVELEQAGQVRLDVYDVQGRLVRSLYNGSLPAGTRSFLWNGNDDSGNRVGSGVYFGRLVAGGTETNHKMVLLK